MKIVVPVKRVPDPATTIRVLADGSGIETNNIKWVINPFDEIAIEEALRIKEKQTGEVVLVNGARWPVPEVDAARYRLRLLNASNARRYRLALTVPGGPDVPFVQIGSDGVQLLGGHGYVKEHPVERWYRDLRAAGVMEGALLV